jgi:hypothetical protein
MGEGWKARDTQLDRIVATSADEMQGNFSPDGHFVAYASNESGKFEVYVETFPRSDRKWYVSTGGGYEPRWRVDGREIYYLSEDRKLMAGERGSAIRCPSASVSDTRAGRRHRQSHELRPIEGRQTISGEHAERRSGANAYYRGVELDSWLEENEFGDAKQVVFYRLT